MTRSLLLPLLLPIAGFAQSQPMQTDVCIYGGTSGGVAAAVQVARMGKSVVLVEPGRHLGGMTSGGLSAVDIGDPRSVGGIAREYFTRLAAAVGRKLAWGEAFDKKGGGPATGGAYAIEPHKAEQVFNDMILEAGVKVRLSAPLIEARRKGARIAEIVTEGGAVFQAKMFIDATYEGDLMAAAGVSHTLMREGNAKYGETHNGIQFEAKFQPRTGHLQPGARGRVPGGQGVWDRDFPLDPFVIKGDPKSGLLPLIDAGEPGLPGEAAPGVQAYCYRLCLSTAADRLPITPPADYDAKRYEIVVRFIEACLQNGDDMDLRWFSKYDALPNEKWDFNTATFGGNLPGASHAWPAASHAQRKAIAKAHEDYHRGLLHFLATDARVPQKVRDDMKRFGLPKDEFQETGGWPHQLYIREARRMVSNLVMTEHHTFGRQVAPKSIGLGSYGTDAHEIRRIVKDGVVTREGKLAGGRGGFGPYQIGYDAIVPKRGECENLLVTFALSASHTAFASIRMEPVFMITSQSAATAACLALETDSTVQALPYEPLKERLIKDGQVIEWKPITKKPAAKKSAATASPRKLLKAEPVRAANAKEVAGRSFDLVVIGGTPGGIACALRAAREGLSVLLVQHNRHLGGMLANGLMQWDALYGGHRSPIFNEYAQRIEDYYRDAHGTGSPQRRVATYSQSHYPMSVFEPSVAEHLFNQLVSAEKNITTLLAHYPVRIEKSGAWLQTLTLREYGATNDLRVTGGTYVDATYEGDLAALAKVPYRIGRESRAEFGEPHAGKIFTNIRSVGGPQAAKDGKLNLHLYGHIQGSIDPTSPATADSAIQAYNHRLCVSNERGNIRLPEKPPRYRREEYLHYTRRALSGGRLNGKSSFNSAILPGENHAYPDATWPEREKIIARHRDFALGLMWFLQNDESIPAASRAAYQRVGLPLDEYADNNNLPYELYVREARRIVGRHVFTEHDNRLAPSLDRTPIHSDSIAFTDWAMDSHDCTTDRRAGYDFDGKLILTEESRPAQVPWRSLLPQGVDNLIVPVCLSATHVAWGAVRLEPVWMQIGEAAGWAAALSKKHHTPPAQLDPDLLLRTLTANRHRVTFFNELLTTESDDPAMAAAQYFGTKGFFASYDARLDQPMTRSVKQVWQSAHQQLLAGKLDIAALAADVQKAEAENSPATTMTRGDYLQALWQKTAASAK